MHVMFFWTCFECMRFVYPLTNSCPPTVSLPLLNHGRCKIAHSQCPAFRAKGFMPKTAEEMPKKPSVAPLGQVWADEISSEIDNVGRVLCGTCGLTMKFRNGCEVCLSHFKSTDSHAAGLCQVKVKKGKKRQRQVYRQLFSMIMHCCGRSAWHSFKEYC